MKPTHELIAQLQVERLLDWRRALILEVELDRRVGSLDDANFVDPATSLLF